MLPVRNGEATLGIALGSVLASRSVNFEVVVVDHGSCDGTAALLNACADPRVRVLSLARDVPFVTALNTGMRACHAPYIARMDADDWMHPARLAADVALLDTRLDVGVVASRVAPFDTHGLAPVLSRYLGWQNAVCSSAAHARDIWVEQTVCQPSASVRRAAFDAVGGYRAADDPTLPVPEDYDFFVRLHCAGWAFAKHPEIMHHWRVHAGQLTWTHPRYSRDAFCRARTRAACDSYALHQRTVGILGGGREAARVARCLKARGVTPSAFFDVADRRVGSTKHGAPVRHMDELATWRASVPNAFALAAVGTRDTRPQVRAALFDAGFVEGRDALVFA